MKECFYCGKTDRTRKVVLFDRFFHEECFHSFVRCQLHRQGFNLNLKRKLNPVSTEEKITELEQTILSVVDKEEKTINQIVQYTKKKKQVISMALNNLRKKGIIDFEDFNLGINLIRKDWRNLRVYSSAKNVFVS